MATKPRQQCKSCTKPVQKEWFFVWEGKEHVFKTHAHASRERRRLGAMTARLDQRPIKRDR